MSIAFPLPRASQQHYTRWYNMLIKAPDCLKNYTILWVGHTLPVRFKSENLSEIIGPHHVFICKKNSDFQYVVIDKSETIYKLPKKYYTSCFPGIQYNSVPKGNIISMKLTNQTTIDLPFIPPSFLQQKKNKTGRIKRKRTSSDIEEKVDEIDFEISGPTWHILQNSQNKGNRVKQGTMSLIRQLIEYSDTHVDFHLKDPFAEISNLEDLKNDQYISKLKLITSFIYHYARSEFGCFVKHTTSNLQGWSEAMSVADI